MNSNPCFAAFAAIEEVPILHYYGLEVLTLAKKVLISSLLLKVDKVDVEEFLKTTFPSKKQIILSPYYGGNASSLDEISFEALEEICIFKPSSEPAPIVTSHNEDKYNLLRVAYVSASSDDKLSVLSDIRDFVQVAVLENLSACIHKEFASYFHPIEKQQLLLLGNRKVYSTDKQKIQRVEQSKRKDEATKKRSEARAALPPTSSKQSAKHSVDPSVLTKAKQDKSIKASNQSSSELNQKRSSRKEINYNEASGNSSSSVEYPVEGKHTDDESQREASDSGNRTPIFNQQVPAPVNFMINPDATLQAAGPPSFYARIPKHKKNRAPKHSKRSPSPDDLDTKPSSNKEKKRLEKKKSSRSSKKSSKKHSKKSRRYSSSSSSSPSSSESESSPSEQVRSLQRKVCKLSDSKRVF